MKIKGSQGFIRRASERVSESYLNRRDIVNLFIFFIFAPMIHESIHYVVLKFFGCSPEVSWGTFPLFMVSLTSHCDLSYYRQLIVALAPYAIEIFLGIIFLFFGYYAMIVQRSREIDELRMLVRSTGGKNMKTELQHLTDSLSTIAGRQFILFGMLLIADVVFSFVLFAYLGLGEDWAFVYLRP